MQRALVIVVLFAVGCSAGPAVTPQIIYVTPAPAMPTAVAAVTPSPSPTPSPTPSPSPTASATPRPAVSPSPSVQLEPLASRVQTTLDAIERETDRIIAASDSGRGGPEIYYAIEAIQGLVSEELAWLASIEATDPRVAPTLERYSGVLGELQGFVDTIIDEWVGVPPAGDYEGPAGEEAGRVIADLLSMRDDLLSIPGDFTVVAAPPTAVPSDEIDEEVAYYQEYLEGNVRDSIGIHIRGIEEIDVTRDRIFVWVESRYSTSNVIKELQYELYDDIVGDISDEWEPDIVIRIGSDFNNAWLQSKTNAGDWWDIDDQLEWERATEFKRRGRIY
jgi:hypothetical protein